MEKTYKKRKIEALRQLIETDNITADELFPAAVPVPVEPTWVIESFTCTDGNATKFSRDIDGEYASTWTQEQMLGKKVAHGIARTVADGSLQIYSIKATPDAPVISISDWVIAECTHMGNTPIQVERFMVNDKNNLLIKTKQFRTHGVGIENCKKVGAPTEKKLLFVTEDDINVYRKQHPILYWLETSTGGTGSDDPDSLYNPNTINYKYWASTKKRQQYISSSKKKAPLFVTEDGVEIYNEHQITWAVSDVWNTPGNRQISEPAPHKYSRQWELNKPPVWHLFSTKTKAQEYMDSKKSPEKPAPLMQVLLTQKEINKLKELLK